MRFKDKRTERFAGGERVPKYEPFRRQAERRLDRLEAATSLDDLRALGGNRLEKLHGDRAGQYSVRINDQWRICFRWENEEAVDVEIVDYH